MIDLKDLDLDVKFLFLGFGVYFIFGCWLVWNVVVWNVYEGSS